MGHHKRLRGAQFGFAVLCTVTMTTISSITANASIFVGENETPGLVSVGWVDVKTLNIVGSIGHETSQVASAPGRESGLVGATPVTEVDASLFITNPPCDGRKDYYRIITHTGIWYCFASSGTMFRNNPSAWPGIRYLCLGVNRGNVYYKRAFPNPDHNYYWSVDRGPERNWDDCYDFGLNTHADVYAVRIQ